MTAPVTPSGRDLRTLAGIVSDHRDDLPPEGLPPSLLADLMSQIRCDALSFQGFDSGRGRAGVPGEVAATSRARAVPVPGRGRQGSWSSWLSPVPPRASAMRLLAASAWPSMQWA